MTTPFTTTGYFDSGDRSTANSFNNDSWITPEIELVSDTSTAEAWWGLCRRGRTLQLVCTVYFRCQTLGPRDVSGNFLQCLDFQRTDPQHTLAYPIPGMANYHFRPFQGCCLTVEDTQGTIDDRTFQSHGNKMTCILNESVLGEAGILDDFINDVWSFEGGDFWCAWLSAVGVTGHIDGSIGSKMQSLGQIAVTVNDDLTT
jgi:hypothetical protein